MTSIGSKNIKRYGQLVQYTICFRNETDVKGLGLEYGVEWRMEQLLCYASAKWGEERVEKRNLAKDDRGFSGS